MNLRNSALAIFRSALDAANPALAVRKVLQREHDTLWVSGRRYDLPATRRLFVVGFGKASAAMAQAVEGILGDRISSGWVTVKYEHLAPLGKIHLHEAAHPLPDENALRGAENIVRIIGQASSEDLVICLISGGGSALLELLVPGVSLDDLRATTDALLRSGATIDELNTVRKHLSQVKGGQLAQRTQAPIISLILSDVIGSPLDTIASGPTAPDSSSFSDALAVLERRQVRSKLTAHVVEHIERGARGELPDTPRVDDPVFQRVQNVIIADNTIACNAALLQAQAQGFNTHLLSTNMQGEARDVGKMLVAMGKQIVSAGTPVSPPACVIAGGETTVTVRGNGKGGRNQELALAAALELAGIENMLVLSGGTDGTDGPTDAAGALADGSTLDRASSLSLDARSFLETNDSYNFFAPLGDLIITGPTNTNVNDVMVLLVS